MRRDQRYQTQAPDLGDNQYHQLMGAPSAPQSNLVNGNPPSNTGAITSGNWGNGQAQDLYGHMGFGQSTVSGNNAAQSIIGQRFAPLLGSRIQSQMLFGNDQEAGRQAMLKRFIRNNNPGARQGKLDAFTRGRNASAFDQSKLNDAMMRSSGMGSGLREGAMMDQSNQAMMDINDFGADLYSPEYDMREFRNLAPAYAMAQETPDLNAFMGINNSMQGSWEHAQANQGGGSILPGLLQAGANYFGGGMGGGGGGGQAPYTGPTRPLGW